MVLRPVNLRWIKGVLDDPMDLCAHGDVEFRIGDDTLLDPASAKNLTVSAAALYLLRTLSVPHTKDAPMGGPLFPCCGFSMYDLPEEVDVVICGCPNGKDFEVVHEVSGAGVVIRAGDSGEWRIGWPEWRAAVFGFADLISNFYAACSPKQQIGDKEDRKGFVKFLAEWQRRRGQKLDVTILSNNVHNICN